MKSRITLLDLFAGIGGFTLGLLLAGFPIDTHYYSEIDPHATAVYRHHFQEALPLGSVTSIKGSDIEKPDIITFGSPCQDFSVAGKRKGLEGERSSLITEAIRIIKETRPDLFIWENVKGTFSSNRGRDFQAILQAFTNIGNYRLEWQLLNTSWFLPQNRQRIFLIGHLDGQSKPGVFPFQQSDSLFNQEGLRKSQEKQRLWSEDIVSTIDARYGSIRNSGETYLLVNSGVKQGFEVLREGNIVDLQQPKSQTRKGRVQIGRTATLDTACNQGIYLDGKIRRLTEIECERLQGFPDDWTKYGNYDGVVKPISRTQRYHQIGNAVTVKVISEIGKRLLQA